MSKSNYKKLADEEIIRLLEQLSSGSEDEESDVDIEKMIFYEKYKGFISEDLTENMFEEATSTELKHTTWTDDRNLLISNPNILIKCMKPMCDGYISICNKCHTNV